MVISISLNLLTVCILVISTILVYRQMKSNHEWNRRRTTHDLIFQSLVGHFSDLREKMEHKIDIYEENEDYNSRKDDLNEEDYWTLDCILNFLDNVCLAIKNNVVTERIVFDCLAGVLISYRRWADSYICVNRVESPRRWIEMDPIVVKWKKDREKIISKLPIQSGCSKL